MAEILVRAGSVTHADPGIDRAGCYKHGDIVLAKPDGHEWGRLEGPPTFVVVKVPGVTPEAAEAWAQSWDYEYDVTVLQRNVAQDGWRFKVVNLQRGASGGATPETERLREFFERWGASFVRRDADGVVLDWRIRDGAMSAGFLGANPATVGVVITETDYDSTAGWHAYSVDWSASTVERIGLHIVKRIVSLGGEIIDTNGSVATYRLPRDKVRDAFVQHMRDASTAYKRRRFMVSPAIMAAAFAAGGTLTLTQAGFAAALTDHRSV